MTRQKTIADTFLPLVQSAPLATAMVLLQEQGLARRLTRQDLFLRALGWRDLYASKIPATGRIAIIIPHSFDLYISYFGAVLGGFLPALLHFPSPKFSRERYLQEIGPILKAGRFNLVVTYPELVEDMRSVIQEHNLEIEVLPTGQPFKATTTGPQKVHPHRPAFLQYSSGTTGMKKGVAITHEMLLWQVETYAKAIDLSSSDVIISWLPLYHDMGLIACYWMPLLMGVPVVAMSPFDWVKRPEMLLKAIEEFKATLCWQPNFAYNLLARLGHKEENHDLSSMRGFINCSEPVRASSHELFYNRYSAQGLSQEKLWGCYAMAENTFAVTGGISTTDKDKASSGVPLAHTDIEIRAGSKIAPEGALGEICIKSPCLFSKYEEQKESPLDERGFYATGDLGYLKQGELYVTGRAKDLIILNGQNIWPQDIESLTHTVEGVIPGRVVAFGVVDADTGSERLVVVAESDVGEEEQAHVHQQVFDAIARGSEVSASDVRIVERRWLVKSSSGKLSRGMSKAKYLELLAPYPVIHAAPAPTPEQETPRIALIRSALESIIGPQAQTVYRDQSLFSTGLLDSLALLRLQLSLEERIGSKLPARLQADPGQFDSIGKMDRMLDTLENTPSTHSTSTGSLRDRRCQWFLEGPRVFDLLMIGSSRVDGLSPARARQLGFSAYNFCVNTAMAEDWYCIMRFVLEHAQKKPSTLLLAIDLEALGESYGPDIRLFQSPYLSSYMSECPLRGVDSDETSRAIEALPIEQRLRAKQLLTQLHSRNAIEDDGANYDPATGELRFTGQGVLDTAFETRQPLNLEGLKTAEDLGGFSIQALSRLQASKQLDPQRLATLDATLDLCQKNQIHVICFIPPIHPALLALLQEKTSVNAMATELTTHLSQKGIELHNCLSPSIFSGIDVDFRDEAHMGAYNADKLLEFLLAQQSGVRGFER